MEERGKGKWRGEEVRGLRTVTRKGKREVEEMEKGRGRRGKKEGVEESKGGMRKYKRREIWGSRGEEGRGEWKRGNKRQGGSGREGRRK